VSTEKNKVSTAPLSSLRSRALLVGLILACAAPLLLATLVYYFRDQLPVPPPNSHGKLIVPPHPFHRFDLTRLNGRSLNIHFLHNRWTLVYVGGSRCDLWCEASLFKMRQVRLALGEDQSRLQRLYLLTDTRALSALRPLLHRYPGMIVAKPRVAARYPLLAAFGPHPSGTFFLVDPHANLMMRYPPDATSSGIKEDLVQLLEVSSIG
jgi:hypothetical protein